MLQKGGINITSQMLQEDVWFSELVTTHLCKNSGSYF